MNDLIVNRLIKKGEGISVEFGEFGLKDINSLFKTVCAFLNRYGGEILISVFIVLTTFLSFS